MIFPCDCPLVAVRSNRETEPGAELVHETDTRGVWHGVKVGGFVYRQTLVTPSETEIRAREEYQLTIAAETAASIPPRDLYKEIDELKAEIVTLKAAK
jgi:hypothetical protein